MKRRGSCRGRCRRFAMAPLLLLVLALNAGAAEVITSPVSLSPGNNRKALVLGYGQLRGDREPTHAAGAKNIFLILVGNPENDPRKGWTCDFSWDLLVHLGLNPTNTSTEDLFRYIRQHKLGYRIAIINGPMGVTANYWGAAVDNGIMPFAPQGNNDPNWRFDDPIGLRSAIGVAGGIVTNTSSYGPGVEFFDALPPWGKRTYEDNVQSWANQHVAAKFARILDAHPEYNIWDARQHLRQAGSFWERGWTERNGYGRVKEAVRVTRLHPAPPVDFSIVKSRDRHRVFFSWRNFLMSDFAATVIARKDGRILYEGTGTNFTWRTDITGAETFVYWSRNKAGEKSRIEPYQFRTVTGLEHGPYRTCVVLGAPAPDPNQGGTLSSRFQQIASNWVCDILLRPGNAYYDSVKSFPVQSVVGVLPDVPSMVTYAITNQYRILLAPVSSSEPELYRYKPEWDRAIAAGLIVVVPHNASLSQSRKPQARRLSPPCLSSAITVGFGTTNNLRSFGPGLEFFDAPEPTNLFNRPLDQLDSAGVVAGKLARILEAFPAYNNWDARQHLRQTASQYQRGWLEDGGYGRPSEKVIPVDQLDPAPPLEIRATKTEDGNPVLLSWQNFLQTSYAETVITTGDGNTVYRGTGTNCTVALPNDTTFKFFTREQSGRLSRPEPYTVLSVTK